MSKTYIKIILDKSASILDCVKLIESIKGNGIVHKVEVSTDSNKKERKLLHEIEIDNHYSLGGHLWTSKH